MRPNFVLERLRAKKPAVGTWLSLHSPVATRLLAAQNAWDWMLVDFEHSPVDLATAAQLFATIADLGQGAITPIARVAAGTMDQVKQALDAGAQGILVPMVSSAAEARAVVSYARFPPDGVRGGGGLLAHLSHRTTRAEYVREANRQVLVGIQLETKEAVDELDAILDVPGIDLVFVGPTDLHLALGLGARSWSEEPAFTEAVARILRACAARGIPCGTLCRDAKMVDERLADGFTFLGLGSDARFLLTESARQFAALHRREESPEALADLLLPTSARER